MSSKKYIINRSNFTLREKHQNTSKGTVYERDFMTTAPEESWEGDVFPWGESKFKMVHRSSINMKKKHSYGDWVTPVGCSSDEKWTLSCAEQLANNADKENEIVLKPDYTSLLDFAYFSSARTQVENTIKWIIANFPAELYVTSNNVERTDATGYVGDNVAAIMANIGLTGVPAMSNPVLVSNPFEIDIARNTVRFSERDNYNPLRYFCKSYDQYTIVTDSTLLAGKMTWDVIYSAKECGNDSLTAVVKLSDKTKTIYIFQYYVDGNYILLSDSTNSGCHIRPNDCYVKNFYNSLDGFSKMLLGNKYGEGYKINITYPYDTDEGTKMYEKELFWPVNDGWNLCISSNSSLYQELIATLLTIADYYDENGYSDIMWGKLTHDSIKNMDSSFTDMRSTSEDSDIEGGISHMQSMESVISNQFDFLKRYIDNVKRVNCVTYDEEGNVPDYFLSDNVELKGWNVKSAVSGIEDASIDGSDLFEGVTNSYTSSDANVQFLRNLSINSREILSHKGTREGIEMILGMFGFISEDNARIWYNSLSGTEKAKYKNPITNKLYDYSINEEVRIAKPKGILSEIVDYNDTLSIENLNSLKEGYDETNSDTLQGLPCILLTYDEKDSKGNVTATKKYCVPWFKDVEDMDGHPYFQMYGGWEKLNKKMLENTSLTDATQISGNTIYNESINYIGIVRTVGDLQDIGEGAVNDGNIYYVYDISDYKDYYGVDTDDSISHYFCIKNADRTYIYGKEEEPDDGTEAKEGWVNVPVSDIKGTKNDGIQVLNLESIINEFDGNNPHGGFGKYDSGEEYFKYFEQLFKSSIDSDTEDNPSFKASAYSCDDGKFLSGITSCGYDIDVQSDSMKTWYFGENKTSDKLYPHGSNIPLLNGGKVELSGITASTQQVKANNVAVIGGDTSVFDPITLTKYIPDKKVGIGSSENTVFKSDINPYSFVTKESGVNDDDSSYSVLNSKVVTIHFNGNDEKRNYIMKSVLPYLEQMIPSTSIVKLEFDSDSEVTKVKELFAAGTTIDQEE